jgi:hypothetical protein
MSASDEAKARGNTLFGQKKYTEAITAYDEGLAVVRGIIVPRAQSHLSLTCATQNMCTHCIHGAHAVRVNGNAHNAWPAATHTITV